MHDIHIYFLFLPLAPSIYWTSSRDFFHTMLNVLNLFFTKESSSEDCSDSSFETCDNPEGDDSFF